MIVIATTQGDLRRREEKREREIINCKMKVYTNVTRLVVVVVLIFNTW